MEIAKFRKLKTQAKPPFTVAILENGAPAYEPEVSLQDIKKGDVFVKLGTSGLFRAIGNPEGAWPNEAAVLAETVNILEDGRIEVVVGGGQEIALLEGRGSLEGLEPRVGSFPSKTLFIHDCGIVMAQKAVRCPGCSGITEDSQWKSLEVHVLGE